MGDLIGDVTMANRADRGWRRAVAGTAVALLLAIAGCVTMPGAPRREELLIQNARAFNDDWRWARWDSMAGSMPKDDGTAFLARAQTLESELVVADFEVTSINFLDESKAAKVVAKFEWYMKRNPVIHNTTVEQRWENTDGRWQMVKVRRTRGDRFGLVTEPATPDPAPSEPATPDPATPDPATPAGPADPKAPPAAKP